ncbi:MAG TPA: carboxypeptidase regulatory-like domain-containing protein [Bryobacteraceae bacterium]|nr:carboxypeptidase regulatory-like domain-containing protein [Bryobacteraceae bacterium]
MSRVFALFVIVLTLALGLSFAQTQAINGSIRGRVTDPAGAAVPGAAVNVINNATGFTRDTQSNDDGYFVIPNLPIGTYTVRVQKEGFETQRHTGVILDAGTEGVIDSALKVGSVSTTVEVSGGAPVIEPSRVSTGRTISQMEVDNLPLTSRNPYNFLLFQPGISGHPNPELGVPRVVNTNGLDNRVQYQLDGMPDTESDQYGLRLFAISDSYVREVQAVSNSFAPEFGRTTGDIYNAITNSGTNQIHGEFYFIGRPPGWSARPILLASNQINPGIDLHDYSMNAGGPIKKDKIFVFGAYEHLLRGTPVPVTITPANAALIGLPTSQLATAGTVQHVQFLDLRVDYNINSKNQFFARYNYFRNEYPFNTNNGGLNALDAGSDFHDRAHVGGFQLLTTFSPTALNELRGSEPYRNEHHVPDTIDGPGPYIVISGIAQFNGTPLSAAGSRFAEKIPSLADNFTKIIGKHTVKTGFSWQQNNDNQTSAVYNQYTFPNVASYLAAKNNTSGCTVSGITNPLLCYSSFSTTQGNPGAAYKSNWYDFFVQDSWQIRPNLLMIYGVRYDYYAAPPALTNAPSVYNQSFRNPGKDWAPRIGFAYSINAKTVLRVSSGIFYDVPSTNLWYQTYANGGLATAFQGSFSPTTAGAPQFPSVPSANASLGTPTIYALDPNYKTPYTINSSIQITRQLSANDALTVGYVDTQARQLTYMRDVNLINPTSYLADGRPVYSTAVNASTRLYPQFNGIRLMDSGANANYNALIVNLTHRFSTGFSMNASYTWSHSLSNAPELWGYDQSTAIEDPTNRNRDYGNSIINRPNAFTMSAVFSPKYKLDNRVMNYLANGNQLTMLAYMSSGDEESITTSTVLNNDPIGAPQRPLGIGRDTVTTPAVYQIDLRLTRTLYSFRERFNVKFIAEGLNVFNTRNITATNTTAATTALGVITANPTFAPVSSVLEGRLLQIGIRADW